MRKPWDCLIRKPWIGRADTNSPLSWWLLHTITTTTLPYYSSGCTQSVQLVSDPQKMLTPPPQLFLSRANCYLKLAKPLLALSDANKELNIIIKKYILYSNIFYFPTGAQD